MNKLETRFFVSIQVWPSGSGEEDRNLESLQCQEHEIPEKFLSELKAHLGFKLRWAKEANSPMTFTDNPVKHNKIHNTHAGGQILK